jgi:hypothetical protein
MGSEKNRGFFRALLDFFILFSGISTASNLARTQGRAPSTRGIFLFRRRPSRDQVTATAPDVPDASGIPTVSADNDATRN